MPRVLAFAPVLLHPVGQGAVVGVVVQLISDEVTVIFKFFAGVRFSAESELGNPEKSITLMLDVWPTSWSLTSCRFHDAFL